MGKPKRRDEVVTKVRRSYSEYNSTNYLISAEDSASAEKDAESDEDKNCAASPVCRGHTGGESHMNKHVLYQRAVQKPKGDISYLHKFFLNYIGGRNPLHLQEDFCGTALICAEWVRGDSRRTAVGLDLDEEALSWGLEHNFINVGSDAYSRVQLFCGDVVDPIMKARKIQADSSTFPHLSKDVAAEEGDDSEHGDSSNKQKTTEKEKPTDSLHDIPGADMICAFNYSCCCLRKRADLLRYFSQAFNALSTDGGIFAMDLYGGTSSECSLKLRRRYDDFQYTWEQEDFDVITRTTRISLHFRLNKNQGVMRHAFSYHWRLWTLPEVKECLEEAGFHFVHFWIREMPDLQGGRYKDEDPDVATKSKYKEVDSFLQADAWNAYVVAVALPRQGVTV